MEIVAQSLSFNTSNISVPADANMTITFNNKDSVSHNFAIYQVVNGGQTKPVFIGSNVAGQKSIVYQFITPGEAGNYFFECDLHPQFMNGPFEVIVP